tara:strand:- start:101 stop:271 length:171 start_codon:yes stop_codon:yes gene_type:complete
MVGVISLYPFNNIPPKKQLYNNKEKEVKVIKNRKIILECVRVFFLLTHPIELPPLG